MKIAITTSTFAEYDKKPLSLLEDNQIEYILNPYRRKLKSGELVELSNDCDGIIAGTELIDKSTLNLLPRLRVISRCGVGMDNVDLKTAKNNGIHVFRTPYGPTTAVAELVIGLMIDMLRKISMMNDELKSGLWDKKMGNLLSQKNIGIIGFGRIGQKVAELLQGFNVNIAYHDAMQIKTEQHSMVFDELLSWSDIITLHCDARKSMKPLIGKDQFIKMKKGSWLINTSRGGLVDENALLESIKNEHLAGAALDVFETEPYRGALNKCRRVIITPHIGSYAKEGRISMEIQSVENLLEGLKAK